MPRIARPALMVCVLIVARLLRTAVNAGFVRFFAMSRMFSSAELAIGILNRLYLADDYGMSIEEGLRLVEDATSHWPMAILGVSHIPDDCRDGWVDEFARASLQAERTCAIASGAVRPAATPAGIPIEIVRRVGVASPSWFL